MSGVSRVSGAPVSSTSDSAAYRPTESVPLSPSNIRRLTEGSHEMANHANTNVNAGKRISFSGKKDAGNIKNMKQKKKKKSFKFKLNELKEGAHAMAKPKLKEGAT